MPRRKKPRPPTKPRGGARKGAGRPKSETTVERERDVRMIAMNQPHRRGMALEWLCSPVGRILAQSAAELQNTSASALHESANRFAEKHQRWQSVVGAPRPFANSMAGSDVPLSDDQAEKFKRQWAEAWRALRYAGERQEKAVFAVVIEPQAEDWRPPFWIVYGCIEGLKALADHFGIDYRGSDIEAKRDAA